MEKIASTIVKNIKKNIINIKNIANFNSKTVSVSDPFEKQLSSLSIKYNQHKSVKSRKIKRINNFFKPTYNHNVRKDLIHKESNPSDALDDKLFTDFDKSFITKKSDDFVSDAVGNSDITDKKIDSKATSNDEDNKSLDKFYSQKNKKLNNLESYVHHMMDVSKENIKKFYLSENDLQSLNKSLLALKTKYINYFSHVNVHNIKKKDIKTFNKMRQDFKNTLVDFSVKSVKKENQLSFIDRILIRSKLRKKISNDFHESSILIINKNVTNSDVDYSWKKIDNSFKLKDQNFRSTQIPANYLLNNKDDIFQDIAYIGEVKYEDGEGVSSRDTKNKDHIASGFQSDFFINGKKVFSGIRHGIVDAYSIKDKKQRKEASKNKARELISLALVSKPEIFKQALKTPLSDNAIPTLNLTSTSLVTASSMGSKKEKMMQKIQNDAFKEVLEENNGIISIPITLKDGMKKNIQVKVNLIEFYTPVNFGGVGALSFITSNRNRQKIVNNKAFSSLLDESEKRIRLLESLKKDNAAVSPSNKTDQEYDDEITKIKLLRTEISDILKNGKHNVQKADTYKLPARILALTSLIDSIPLFNCKSGKDRTSMAYTSVSEVCVLLEEKVGLISSLNKIAIDDEKGMNTFIESLSIHELNLLNQLHTKFFEQGAKDKFTNHDVKDIRKKVESQIKIVQKKGDQNSDISFEGKTTKKIDGLDDVTKEVFSTIAIKNGNLEVQQNNTVLPGYKVRGVQITEDRPVTDMARNQIYHYSKFVRS